MLSEAPTHEPSLHASALERDLLEDTTKAARTLLGCLLVRDDSRGRRVGRIVETEAYLHDDPACHAFHGLSARNASMFGRAGAAYVYRIHRSHCFNVVTGPSGRGEAVLVRALEPVEGHEAIRYARERATVGSHTPRGVGLTNGPGKLCQAFDIDVRLDGVNLLAVDPIQSPLRLLARDAEPTIVVSARVGISRACESLLRFFIEANPWVSR